MSNPRSMCTVEGVVVSVPFAQAIITLRNELRDHPDYREAWKANIAMAFQDSWRWDLKDDTEGVSREDIHRISNMAADHFLGNLVGDKKETK